MFGTSASLANVFLARSLCNEPEVRVMLLLHPINRLSGNQNMAAPEEIKQLVSRFADNLADYKSGNYNETQVRREFIDPMFTALGWDVANKESYAEAYKDVVHEARVKVGGLTKAPDYGFRIGGARKFFLEAKKPSVRIKEDEHPAYQLRRYAWSAKLPLSVLTDFEEFAVYDCRIKPGKGDSAGKARVLYFTFDQYEDHWDEIAAIFSKEAILKGSFDKYAEDNKSKRGTAEVDDAFLDEIERWRELLAKNIALRNNLSVRELNFSVQKTIDRIIFLRICEDRGIEGYGRLQSVGNGSQVYSRLLECFDEANARYNSGLFHFTSEPNRPDEPDHLTPTLKIDDKPLKDILKHLYYPDSPYEFSVLPADILGQVYEQFLGYVIELTPGGRAKVEQKPEVKKAGGVYYTPTYIVDYIVQNTVGELLKERRVAGVSASNIPHLDKPLRVLDPACGSGSFLIGAYQYLLDWHRDWYQQNNPKKWARKPRPPVYQTNDGGWALTLDERKRILLDHIYGVDIDNQAVEVTKLSLLLKVLEPQKLSQIEMYRERVLPDLALNIKCGNSLIGPDFYENKQTELLEEDIFSTNVFDWAGEYPEIFGTDVREDSKMQKSAGGFDVVIGNPPYGSNFDQETKQYLLENYPNQNYQLDKYQLFMEASLSCFLAQGGLFGMIIPNPWITNILQKKIRQYIFLNVSIKNIVHFKYAVFPKVTVDTQIMVIANESPNGSKPTVKIIENSESLLNKNLDWMVLEVTHEQDDWISCDGDPINIFLNKHDKALRGKCFEGASPLEKHLKIKVGIKPYQKGKGKPPQKSLDVKSRIFDSKRKINAQYRQYLRGRDIQRYLIAPLEVRFIKYGEWLAEPRPTANFDAVEKLFMRQTGDSLVAAYDPNQMLCLNNMHVLVPDTGALGLKFYLGLLNSKLMNWLYQTLNPEAGEALAEVKRSNLAKLPIKEGSDSEIKTLMNRVDAMLNMYEKASKTSSPHDKKLISRRILAAEHQIDQLVYKLYRLNDDEIRIVEESTA